MNDDDEKKREREERREERERGKPLDMYKPAIYSYSRLLKTRF